MIHDDPFAVRKKPAAHSAVIALKDPGIIGQVFIIGNYRYTIEREISQQEFLERTNANLQHPAGVAGVGGLNGSSVAEFESCTKPPDNLKYFFSCRVELLPSRSGQ